MTDDIDISAHNERAWDEESREGSEWCTPVSTEVINRARKGYIELRLTPKRFVPSEWLTGIEGKRVLCLASGGGQQAPVLAAAGAHVISYDISREQLDKDLHVADRDGLKLQVVKGEMSDLSPFDDDSCDIIVNAVSDIFVSDISVVWKECRRVLRPGGELWSGMMNPSFFLFDHADAMRSGELIVKHSLPYSDTGSLDDKELGRIIDDEVPLVWSHTLESLLGGLTDAGFHITAFYEDAWSDEATPLNRFTSTTFVVRALKPF